MIDIKMQITLLYIISIYVNKCLDVPWRSILTSTPFLVVIVAHIGHNWGFYCLLTELPTYLKNIQHYDMKQVHIYECIGMYIDYEDVDSLATIFNTFNFPNKLSDILSLVTRISSLVSLNKTPTEHINQCLLKIFFF